MIYSALCRPGVTTERQVAKMTGLSLQQVEEGIQSLLARYYIHTLPSSGYIVR